MVQISDSKTRSLTVAVFDDMSLNTAANHLQFDWKTRFGYLVLYAVFSLLIVNHLSISYFLTGLESNLYHSEDINKMYLNLSMMYFTPHLFVFLTTTAIVMNDLSFFTLCTSQISCMNQGFCLSMSLPIKLESR